MTTRFEHIRCSGTYEHWQLGGDEVLPLRRYDDGLKICMAELTRFISVMVLQIIKVKHVDAIAGNKKEDTIYKVLFPMCSHEAALIYNFPPGKLHVYKERCIIRQSVMSRVWLNVAYEK